MKLNKWIMLTKVVNSMSGLKKKLNENDSSLNNSQEKWIQNKDARNWALTRLAHEGMMIDKIQRQNKIVQNTVKGLQSDSDMNTSDGDEDMGVSIGNEHNTEHHYHQNKSSNSWLPLSVVAAGALTGAGLYFGNKGVDLPLPQSQTDEISANQLDVGVGFGQPKIIPITKDNQEGDEDA